MIMIDNICIYIYIYNLYTYLLHIHMTYVRLYYLQIVCISQSIAFMQIYADHVCTCAGMMPQTPTPQYQAAASGEEPHVVHFRHCSIMDMVILRFQWISGRVRIYSAGIRTSMGPTLGNAVIRTLRLFQWCSNAGRAKAARSRRRSWDAPTQIVTPPNLWNKIQLFDGQNPHCWWLDPNFLICLIVKICWVALRSCLKSFFLMLKLS